MPLESLPEAILDTLEINWETDCSQAGALARNLLYRNGRDLRPDCSETARPAASLNWSWVQKRSAVQIYPNPANNMLYISNIAGINKVEIYSVVGNLVKSIEDFPNSRGQAGINVSDLPAGMYIIRINGTPKNTTSRFVISR